MDDAISTRLSDNVVVTPRSKDHTPCKTGIIYKQDMRSFRTLSKTYTHSDQNNTTLPRGHTSFSLSRLPADTQASRCQAYPWIHKLLDVTLTRRYTSFSMSRLPMDTQPSRCHACPRIHKLLDVMLTRGYTSFSMSRLPVDTQASRCHAYPRIHKLLDVTLRSLDTII